MYCKQYRDVIQELVDGTLGPVRRAELQTHLDQCDACTALASDLRKTGEGAYSGELYRTAGPHYLAQPWDPGSVTVTRVGSATLAFSGPDSGTFNYTVGAVSGSKPITRQIFAAPPTFCR